MALSRALPRPALRVLIALPSGLRHSVYRQHLGTRNFSLGGLINSPADIAGAFAAAPAIGMEALHACGLPWYAVFPVSAILLRSLLVYPLFQRQMRRRLTEKIMLQPLVNARLSLRKRLLMTHGRQSDFKHRAELLLHSFHLNRFLGASVFGQPWLSVSRGLSFFTLISVSESIRRLCGLKEGLLTMLLGPFQRALEGPSAAPKEPPPAPVNNVALDDGLLLDSFPAALPEPNASFCPDAVQSALPTTPHAIDSPWFEPELLTDGLPWCVDLTVSDPTLVLPVLFSGSFFLSIYFSGRIAGASGSSRPTNLQRIGMTVALLMFFPALKMPAALLLYLTTNIWVSAVQSRWLAYTMPIRPVPTACRRPVRMQPMKELGDNLINDTAKAMQRK